MFKKLLARFRKPKNAPAGSPPIDAFASNRAAQQAAVDQEAIMNAAPLDETLAQLDALADEIQHEPVSGKSPEELCGITAEMTPEEIRAHLAVLYRRYNRTASSLNAGLREEAEIMLDAIVHVRESILPKS